ncbi:ubiquinone biosynthesis UbiH/UbiF/VisC/COQ6 family hydroxylase [Sphaerotilus hippei]|uniref:Ubiquinone biosynthesis UbiH/UbiF/VisC/COQ6 family hydroxylase n=1 Tax=Sphaerotilus hippei TaxID=744406 RepID=A0A318GYC2_9BURK|nr:5-demethoxyubiquinol-8 5-hydroxylase UbiM [Sphaerotilus hippei]PXW91916.1 ubiquinone biosynthesis UbiH/UbiF/VisC/COQ6 family hydroxylase [Sphaerotilus hippei]
MHPPTPDADVLIVGAGPAGLALASALSDAGLTAILLEQQARDTLERPADDGREIALTHRARAVMGTLGLWSQVPAEAVSPLRQAHVLDGESPGLLRFGVSGDEALGWLIANHQIRRAAFRAAMARPGVQLRCAARVTGLDLGGPLARVTLADGQCLNAPLVVAADSRLSQTRRLAGIGASMHDFGRSVVVGPVAHEREHQGVALECFRYGNTLALLPMQGRCSSAVVTVAADRAGEWSALDDAGFAQRIEAQSGGRLGTMRCVGPRQLHPLVGVYAHRFVAPRFALIGDAAVGMHPVTAHGYNFGLYGVEVLVGALKAARGAGRDIGAPDTLQPYEAAHRRTTLPVYLGTNAVVSLFTDERAPARLARKAVLAVAEHAPGLSRLIKGAINRQLTGGPGLALPR